MTPPTRETGSTIHIIGIDPGYERCGFAVVSRSRGSRETLTFSECFTTPKQEVFETRLHAIGVEFERLLTLYQPSICALERLYFTTNQKTGMHVAEVRGMLLYLSTRYGVPVAQFGPNEVKVAITGDGRATKDQMILMVPRLISVPHTIQYDDEYDAIAVALTASATYTTPTR